MKLTLLTFQSKRHFTLPWERLPEGFLRFSDRGRLGRAMRLWCAWNVWVLGLACLGWIAIGRWAGPFPIPLSDPLNLILSGMAVFFGVVGMLVKGPPRWRRIDIDRQGRVRIHVRNGWVRSAEPPFVQGRLELVDARLRVGRVVWKAPALIVSASGQSAMLCMHRTLEECLDVLAILPDPLLATLPQRAPHMLSASEEWP